MMTSRSHIHWLIPESPAIKTQLDGKELPVTDGR